MMKNFPEVSIIIPTFNEEENIGSCLEAIFQQHYPQKKLEVLVVDNYSVDKTVEIVKKYPVKLFFNKIRDAQSSKMLAFKKLKTEFFCYLDADVKIIGRNWLKKMLYPHFDNPQIVGSFPRFRVDKKDNSLNRFLSHDELQRDPVFKFFSNSVQNTIIERKKGYHLCRYQPKKIPPMGLCLYRRKFLLRTKIPKMKKLMELDNLEILVRAGYRKFAYVPSAGIYHFHIKSLGQLTKKRIRNLQRNFLSSPEERYYTWIDLSQPKEILKLVFWIFYANLFLPAFLKGAYKSIKHWDWACLWEPLVTLLVTDLTIYQFFISPKGRRVIFQMIRTLLRR